MSKYRYVKSDFWVDEYIEELSINEKFLFLYFLTNPQTNILGIYKSSVKRINFETGLQKSLILPIIDKFSNDDKIHFINGYIIIVNFQKNQNPNGKMKEGIKKLITILPFEVLEFLKSTKSNIYHRLYIGFYRECIDYTYNHINKNININKNKDINQDNEEDEIPTEEEPSEKEKRWEEFKNFYPRKNGKLLREETGKKIFFKSSVEFQKKAIIAAENYSLSEDVGKGFILGLGNFLRDSVDEWQNPEQADSKNNVTHIKQQERTGIDAKLWDEFNVEMPKNAPLEEKQRVLKSYQESDIEKANA